MISYIKSQGRWASYQFLVDVLDRIHDSAMHGFVMRIIGASPSESAQEQ